MQICASVVGCTDDNFDQGYPIKVVSIFNPSIDMMTMLIHTIFPEFSNNTRDPNAKQIFENRHYDCFI